MLSFFRRGIMAKLMLGILAIGLFAIVITGFGTGGMGIGGLGGIGGGAVARVGGEAVTATQVTDEAQRQLSRMRQQRPELDMASFLRGGALEEIVNQMVELMAVVMFGKENGLAVSRAMIDREIAGIPAFQNLAGQFDQATFERALAQERLTEEQLRREIEGRLIQRQLMLPAAGSAYVPQGLAFQYASLLLESRTGIVGAVPTTAMGAGREPTDAEVAAFYRENPSRYAIPERRVLRYALFGRENVADQVKATDAEIAAAYRNNQAYAAKETRTLSQVVLPDEAAARRLAQQVAGGASFAQAASQAGFSASDTAIGEQTRDAFAGMTSPQVAAAAWGAAAGATVGPVRSPLGWHVVRVDDINTTPARPLQAVRAEIVAGIEAQKAQKAINDLAGRIETALAEGSTFDEVARTERLTVQETAPVTATGTSPDNPAYQVPPELRPALKTAFEMAPDEDPVVETIAANERYAIIAIARAIPAAPPPLQRIAAQVKADLIARRASERARAVASAIVSKINAGTSPDQAFAQSELRLPGTQRITATRREIARGEQVPPPLAMMFSLPRGKARLLPAPNGSGWFVVYLEQVVPGNAGSEPALVEAVKSQFAQILGDEYAQQFSTAIRTKSEVERNEDALRELKAQLMGTGAAQ